MKLLITCLSIACAALIAVVLVTQAGEQNAPAPQQAGAQQSVAQQAGAQQPTAQRGPERSERIREERARTGARSPDDADIVADIDAEEDEDPVKAFHEACRTIESVLNKKGEQREEVYIVTYPRDDLYVTMDGWDVPTDAGLESDFRFFRCPCGKMLVMGQFVVTDYETNDVVDALRQGHLIVSSVSPLLLYERPRLMLIRFQGEGKAAPLATTLKQALEWTGEARMAPQKKVGFGADADEEEDCCGEENQ